MRVTPRAVAQAGALAPVKSSRGEDSSAGSEHIIPGGWRFLGRRGEKDAWLPEVSTLCISPPHLSSRTTFTPPGFFLLLPPIPA